MVDMDDADLSETVQTLSVGMGGKQAIQLGLTGSADWVLLDDLPAREEAQWLELRVKGMLRRRGGTGDEDRSGGDPG